MQRLLLRPTLGLAEFPELVAIWRSAVDATHDFLTPADRLAIEQALASDYFPQVALTVAEQDGKPVGFAGTAAERLEMLFVHAEHFGQGIGSQLLAHVLAQGAVHAVDVNEQNPRALAFYRTHGFVVHARSPHDGEGRAYPLLHLRLPR